MHLYLVPGVRLHACLVANAAQHPPPRSAWTTASFNSAWRRVPSPRILPCDASTQPSTTTLEPAEPPSEPRSKQDVPQPTTTPRPGRRGRPRKMPTLPSQAAAQAAKQSDTELVFLLERRGHGWGEEIIPHLVVDERPIPAKKKTHTGPAPWEEGSLEQQLLEMGIPREQVEPLVGRLVAWRTTRQGRRLVDRRRRRRVERNGPLVTAYLQENGVKPEGVGALVAQVPEVLLCKPSNLDRWDRRLVELAAFWSIHGHCDVPEAWHDPSLAAWVKRQRMAFAQGQLSEERVLVLRALRFEFGEVVHLTADWERRFDALLDWVMWCQEGGGQVDWVGLDWGARGGIAARQLCLWVQLQRELHRRGMLRQENVQRLEAIGFQWHPSQAPSEVRTWLSQLGRLLLLIERGRSSALVGGEHALLRGPLGVPPEMAARGLGRRYRLQVALEQEVASRRLALSKLTLQSGLGYWLAKQRWRWRHGTLDQERALILELAGVELATARACGTAEEPWHVGVQRAAVALIGSGVRWPGTPQLQPTNRVALRRWAWTQRALWSQGRLRPEQQRFLALCGVTWVLSSEVLFMRQSVWDERCAALAAAVAAHQPQPGEGCVVHAAVARVSPLRDWLQHQKALRVLGMLPREREVALSGMGLDWLQGPGAAQQEWDSAVSRLLAWEAAHGRTFDGAEDEQLQGWVVAQQAAAREGRLSSGKQAALKLLGITW